MPTRNLTFNQFQMLLIGRLVLIKINVDDWKFQFWLEVVKKHSYHSYQKSRTTSNEIIKSSKKSNSTLKFKKKLHTTNHTNIIGLIFNIN